MKTVIIIIYVYVALLPSIIHGNDGLRKRLDRIALKNGIINDLFQPISYLGGGSFSITYKCKLLKPIDREVAMKFTPISDGKMAKNEYEAFSDLGAINNTNVEQFGIPTVYYYGEWDEYVLMAITLLDSEFKERCKNRTLKDVDVLIVAREFVKISKYIHSCGVHHNDIKLDNIMFLKNKLFIIDFNLARRLHRSNSFRMFGIPPENVYEDRRCFSRDDWGCFLHSICVYIGVKFKAFDDCATCNLLVGNSNISKSKIKSEIENIDKIENKRFKRVCVEMAKNVFKGVIDLWPGIGKRKFDDYQDTIFPLYDDLYRIINDEINKFELPKPAFVSWLTTEDRDKAKEELEKKPLPDISSIKDHFENIYAEYPKVNFNYFTGLKREE